MRFCQARSFRTSSRSAREAANACPRRSSGRLASSQPRTSLRNASSRSVKSKFIWRRELRFLGEEGSAPLSTPPRTRGALLHHHAAVDVQRLTGDVACFVGSEKDGGPADVLGGLLPLHRRDVADALVEHLARRHAFEGGVRLGEVGGELLPEVRPEDARSDRVHGDPVGRQLLGDDARQRDHAHLGHAVGRHRRRRDGPGDRGDVDDPPRLPLDEVGRDRLARQEDRLRVDREGAVPVLLGIVGEGHPGRSRGPRVVDEDVDLTERLAHAVDHRLDVGGAGDVGLHGEDLAAQSLNLAGDLLSVQHLDVGDGDIGAFARQCQRDATADPAATARHDRDLTVEPHEVPLEFPTISLGEVLMKPTTMLFRNLMAMDVEECIRAYPLDAVVLLSGCDKTTPAMVMGAASADVPAVMVTGGPMLSGKWRAEELGSGTDAWRLWAERRAGRLSDEELCEAESCMSRSGGHCMVMWTASTMASVVEALGMTLPGNAAIPASDSRRLAMAEMAGRRAVEMAIAGGPKPSQILTAQAFDNAIRADMAIGGSTNPIIHLVPIARPGRG